MKNLKNNSEIVTSIAMAQFNTAIKTLGGRKKDLLKLCTLLGINNWREENDVVYFSVTSYGVTAEKWERDFSFSDRIYDVERRIILSKNFKTTNLVTYEIAVLKSSVKNYTHKEIREEAEKRGFSIPNIEISCLIREKFTNDEIASMGFGCIVIMHEPVMVCKEKNNENYKTLLTAGPNCCDSDSLDGERVSDIFKAHKSHSDFRFSSIGFAFVVSQTNLNSPHV